MMSFEIQSDMRNLPEVEGFVERLCDNCNIGNHSAIITMALLNAVENAIVHGNRNDNSKKVYISCEQNANTLLFRVRDEGDGFPYEDYNGLDKLLDEFSDGMFLLKTLCDEISFDEGGSVLCMSFFIKGVGHHIAAKRASVLQHFYASEAIGVV